MGKLALHGSTVSPFVRKVKIVLIEKSIDHDSLSAFPSQEAEFLKISPLGKIPALTDEEGRCINDSSVMIAYLEERFPEKSVLPQDLYSKAQARWFEEYADSTIAPTLVFGIFGQKIIRPFAFNQPTDEKVVSEAIAAAPKILEYLEGEIKGKDYFVENTYGLADISLACMFDNLDYADFKIDNDKYPSLSKWYTSISERYSDIIAADKEFIEKLKNRT